MPSLRKKMAIELFEKELTSEQVQHPVSGNFSRKFQNPDGVSCWLNSLLQLILAAFDHGDRCAPMESDLGLLLENYQRQMMIDPRPVKNLLQDELNASAARYQQIMQHQQCARDGLIILTENKESWLDVYRHLYHSTKQTSTCANCQSQYSMQTDQLYTEVFCPENNTSLKSMLESNFNGEESRSYRCDECKFLGEASFKLTLVTEASSKFLVIQVKRIVENYSNNIDATEDVKLIDSTGHYHTYKPISIIHHR
jgi:hypothetical protein